MSLRRSLPRAAILMAAALAAVCACAQGLIDNPDWRETDAPPPPAFSLDRLVKIDMGPNVGLQYGVDPASVAITSDGVVRYVMVASSSSGATNALYEGIRCATGEFKSYGRFNDGQWTLAPRPEWQSLFGSMPSKHAMAFARQGGCVNTAPPASVKEMVRILKNPRGDLPR